MSAKSMTAIPPAIPDPTPGRDAAVSEVAVDAAGPDAAGASHLAIRSSQGVIRGYIATAGAVTRRSHNEEQGESKQS